MEDANAIVMHFWRFVRTFSLKGGGKDVNIQNFFKIPVLDFSGTITLIVKWRS